MGIHKWHQKRQPRRASRKLRKTMENVLQVFVDVSRAKIRGYVKNIAQPTTPALVGGKKRLNHLHMTFNPSTDLHARNRDRSKPISVRLHGSCYKISG